MPRAHGSGRCKSAGRRNRAAEEAEKEAAAALEREQRENYNRINDGADEAFRNSDYAAAISQYNEALAIFPDERYPKQRIGGRRSVWLDPGRGGG